MQDTKGSASLTGISKLAVGEKKECDIEVMVIISNNTQTCRMPCNIIF